MRQQPHSIRRHGTRRRIVALALAYLLAVQGLLVAWGTVSAVAASLSPAGVGIICSSSDATGAPHRSNDSDAPPPCCACGPLCFSGGAVPLCAVPEATILRVLRPASTLAEWSRRTADVPARTFLSPQQARAPPAMA
jgi:hypothetical protein